MTSVHYLPSHLFEEVLRVLEGFLPRAQSDRLEGLSEYALTLQYSPFGRIRAGLSLTLTGSLAHCVMLRTVVSVAA